MWEKTYGREYGVYGQSVQATKDGGYIVAGTTRSYGATGIDVYLLKVDGSGNKVWEKTYGGTGDDYGQSVQATKDGGYIVAGYTTSFGAGLADFYLVKVDSSGNKMWEKTYGGAGWDQGNSVQVTSGGGYIIAGHTNSFGAGVNDFYLVKVDRSGNKMWAKTYGGSGSDQGNSVQVTSDGGYIISGMSTSFGNGSGDVYLVKVDRSGNKVWEKTYGGTQWDNSWNVQVTKDGGYIIAGVTESFGDQYGDVYLVKTDSSGNKIWEKTYGGTGMDWGYSVHVTSDGGYIITGTISAPGNVDTDVYLVKIDGSGNKLWEKTYGGAGWDQGNSVQVTSDGGYIVTGFTGSFGSQNGEVYLVKVAPTPAAFTLSGLTISPSQVYVNKPVTVSVTVKNTGEASGSYKVTLMVNGATQATKTVTLSGGAQTIAHFSVIESKAGTYSVAIGSLTSSFKVLPKTR
jgi:protein involved in ribonucleotide reduction